MKKHWSVCMAALVIILFTVSNARAADFPGREKPKYQKASYIEIDNLYKEYSKGEPIIVDVRSKLEYDTIHIKGAQHVPLGNTLFERKIKAIGKKNAGKKIVFYCNGTTCYKSYEAQLRAAAARVPNTHAFDLGIPGWAELFPEETVLLGKMMTESRVKWIPKSEFRKKSLSWEKFKEMSAKGNSRVIDARDNVQKGILTSRVLAGLSPEERRNLDDFIKKNKTMLSDLSSRSKVVPQPLDKLVKNIIQRGMFKDRRLLLFDQVGKQVRWLMYRLEEAGYTEYYFLAKGAQGVIGIQAYSD